MENKKLEDLKVVQANSLIQQTNWTLDKVPLKLFKALVAEIDTKSPPADGIVTVSKKELVKLLDGEQTHHNYLKNRLRDLQRTSMRVVNDDTKEVFVPLVIDIEWEKDTDIVRAQFSPKVMPYLIVAGRFLQYSAADLKQFKSKYGLVLYEQLLSRQRQTGEMNCTLTVKYLRWITGTTDQYNEFHNWEKRVLKAGVDDLNAAGVSFLTKYKKNRQGRENYSITFMSTPRMSWKDTTYEEAWTAKKMKDAQRRNPDLIIEPDPQYPDPPEQQLSLFDIDPVETESDTDDIFKDNDQDFNPEEWPF